VTRGLRGELQSQEGEHQALDDARLLEIIQEHTVPDRKWSSSPGMARPWLGSGALSKSTLNSRWRRLSWGFRRREVLHFNVTDHPTSAWVAHQMIEAVGDRTAPRYLIRDRDRVYGEEARERLQSLDIDEVLTAPQSPWQNGYAERLIGSIRRECLNHFVILSKRHLKRTLTAYFRYYHRTRTHLALDKQCPLERQVMARGAIVVKAEVGGLHHRYERLAA
jgi:transposase InsO family protein